MGPTPRALPAADGLNSLLGNGRGNCPDGYCREFEDTRKLPERGRNCRSGGTAAGKENLNSKFSYQASITLTAEDGGDAGEMSIKCLPGGRSVLCRSQLVQPLPEGRPGPARTSPLRPSVKESGDGVYRAVPQIRQLVTGLILRDGGLRIEPHFEQRMFL
ncbi:hypothetical protein GCM10010272_01210 [Streptomyces lateritius]|nr:hypothetical protein GCM10010272_01210 [Streptomyces lateritius]